MRPINVGLLGIGTVGGGTFAVLKRNAQEITRRAGMQPNAALQFFARSGFPSEMGKHFEFDRA